MNETIKKYFLPHLEYFRNEKSLSLPLLLLQSVVIKFVLDSCSTRNTMLSELSSRDFSLNSKLICEFE